jgi:fructose-specific phosphotransferase system IIA component
MDSPLRETQIMNPTEFIVPEAIIAQLQASDREGAIREMVESLHQAGVVTQPEEIVKAILRRELLGSTGIGRGVAIPHAKHNSIERQVGTVAISRAGVPFDSIDGEPVNLFVLLLSPMDEPVRHLRALEQVSRVLRDENLVRALRQAPTMEAIWHLLAEQEQSAVLVNIGKGTADSFPPGNGSS